jgi:uncharacterized protein YjbJ (UPF0337 family)
MLNKDVVRGKIKEIKGEIKTKWGKLTGDDLVEIRGNEEKLIGILQKRYGYTREQAEKEYKEWIVRQEKRAA